MRERHGRGPRSTLLPRSVPRHRSRSAAFDHAVLKAYAPLAERFSEQLAAVDVAVDTVPRMRLRRDLTVLPPEIFADGPVPLGRIIPAGVDEEGRPTHARLVIFRMPVEQRAADEADREALLSTVVTALVAAHLNVEPQTIDPNFRY